MKDELITILKTELNIDLPSEPDIPLLSSGIINSFEVTHLLAILRQHYHVSIHPAEIGVDNFDTIEQISEYLESHR